MTISNFKNRKTGFVATNTQCVIWLLILVCTMLNFVGYAEEVVGSISQNTLWSLANSPYHVTQDIRLVIEQSIGMVVIIMVNRSPVEFTSIDYKPETITKFERW